MLTPEQLKYISDSVNTLLEDYVDTLIEKVGKGHEKHVAQFLVNATATFRSIMLRTVLEGVKDPELKVLVDQIYHCLIHRGVDDPLARQIARQYIGNDEETAAVRQVVSNAAVQYLTTRAMELNALNQKAKAPLSEDFRNLLENTSTEDADQKEKRRQIPMIVPPAVAERARRFFLPDPVRPAPVLPQDRTMRQPEREIGVRPLTEPRPEQPIGIRPRHIQTHPIPIVHSRLFSHRVGPRGTPPENYRVFFVGRRADFYFSRLQDNMRERDLLQIQTLPDDSVGLTGNDEWCSCFVD